MHLKINLIILTRKNKTAKNHDEAMGNTPANVDDSITMPYLTNKIENSWRNVSYQPFLLAFVPSVPHLIAAAAAFEHSVVAD